MALNHISKGGTGVLRGKILLRDSVTSEIPAYEHFFLQRIVKHSIQRTSQHFGLKLLIFSVGKGIAFRHHRAMSSSSCPTAHIPANWLKAEIT